MFKTIIAATDGSDNGTRAVKLAARLARLSKAKLVLVHVRPHYATASMLQQAIASKRRLPAGVVDEITRLKRLRPSTTGVQPALPMYEILSQGALDAIASLTLHDAEKAAKAARPLTVDKALLRGDPAENILSVAKKKKADVIVLGRRGMGGFARLLFGSVSQKVSQLAGCPVLTVK